MIPAKWLLYATVKFWGGLLCSNNNQNNDTNIEVIKHIKHRLISSKVDDKREKFSKKLLMKKNQIEVLELGLPWWRSG